MNKQTLQNLFEEYKQNFVLGEEEGNASAYIIKHGLGTKFAFFMAFYNLFKIKQNIIKNSIFLTRSNKPLVVKGACVVVGSIYYGALFVIWNVPFFFVDIAIRSAYAIEAVTTNHILRGKLHETIFTPKRVSGILNDYDVHIIK